jgi:hypothetical protein
MNQKDCNLIRKKDVTFLYSFLNYQRQKNVGFYMK